MSPALLSPFACPSPFKAYANNRGPRCCLGHPIRNKCPASRPKTAAGSEKVSRGELSICGAQQGDRPCAKVPEISISAVRWATLAGFSPLLADASSPVSAVAAAQSYHLGASQVIADVADIDAKTAGIIARVLQPFLSISILFMIIRIVLSWYPQIPGNKLPWSVVVKPTEPLLGPTRQLIKPVGGVDISPIIWVALLSFINEILLGPQGILNLLQRKIDF